MSATVGVETLKNVLAQMGGEGWLRISCRAVDRARAAALLGTAAQVVEYAQVLQDLLQCDLLPQKCEVDLGAQPTAAERQHSPASALALRWTRPWRPLRARARPVWVPRACHCWTRCLPQRRQRLLRAQRR